MVKGLLVQLFLRIYAVVYLVLYLEGLAFATARAAPTPIQLVDMLFFTPVAVIGLWSAAYRHLNLPKHGWKILLFASVFWRPFALGNAILSGDAIPKFQALVASFAGKVSGEGAIIMTLLVTVGLCFLGSLLILPPLVALYRNAYGDESLLRLMSPSSMRVAQPADPVDQLGEAAQRQAAEVS
jgi:hypothetical protein